MKKIVSSLAGRNGQFFSKNATIILSGAKAFSSFSFNGNFSSLPIRNRGNDGIVSNVNDEINMSSAQIFQRHRFHSAFSSTNVSLKDKGNNDSSGLTEVRGFSLQQRAQIAEIEMDVLKNKLKTSDGTPTGCPCHSSSLEGLLEYNKRWAKRVNEISPTFFTEGAKSQHPEYLWIGCSDSRVVPNTMLGLIPGEIFVHRNIANVIPRSDINATSVIQFSVEYLKVKEIIVCGHQNCKGIAVTYATIGGPSGSLKAGKAIVSTNGTVDNWIVDITEVLNRHLPLLNSIPNENNRPNALSEINVVEQLVNVAESVSVHTRWCEERQGNVGSGGDKKYPHKLRLNGWMYMLTTGLIEPVCTFTAEDDVRQKASETIKKIIEKYSKAK